MGKEDRAMRQTISIAQLVEHKLEALVAEVTGGGEGKQP
jgi:hypothetical protein